jgi:hypothetical protein
MSQATQLDKRAAEIRRYTFDFSLFPEIVAGDTLTGTPVITLEQTLPKGTVAVAPVATSIVRATSAVTCVMTGGEDGSSWRVECTCTTTGGFTLVCVGYLRILED